ncbi:hemolysin family protein [Planctomycetota bacterium]
MPIVLFLTWLAVLIFLSAFFSCSETSLFSLNQSDISYLKENRPHWGRTAERLLANPRKTLITILIGNMFVNILSTAMAEEYLHHALGPLSILISLIVMTPLILIFGEIAPKIIAFQVRRRTVPVIAGIIRLLYFVFYPVQIIIFAVSNPFILFFARVFPVEADPDSGAGTYSDEEIEAGIGIGVTRGIFDTYEERLIINIMKFGHVTARHILTPRTAIESVDINQPVDAIRRAVYASKYARIPFCQGSKDNIIGVFLQKDILTETDIFTDTAAVRQHLNPPYFVPETIKADRLFHLMVKRQMHIHFVVDEYGGLAGLVTLEDILEDVFGTIRDEKSGEPEFSLKPDSAGVYIVKAHMTIDDFNRELEPRIEHEDAITVGGFMCARLGRIPSQGDTLEYRGYVFAVTAASPRQPVLIEILPPARAGEDG